VLRASARVLSTGHPWSTHDRPWPRLFTRLPVAGSLGPPCKQVVVHRGAGQREARTVSRLSAATPRAALHRTTTPRSARGPGLRRRDEQRGRVGRWEPAGLRSHRSGQGIASEARSQGHDESREHIGARQIGEMVCCQLGEGIDTSFGLASPG
jgi:hypothetical protein